MRASEFWNEENDPVPEEEKSSIRCVTRAEGL
jgi:hypothetical protein